VRFLSLKRIKPKKRKKLSKKSIDRFEKICYTKDVKRVTWEKTRPKG
jgi:hypothetical protein